MKGFWYYYYAKVKNNSGIHTVFYCRTRPKIGIECEGIAKPNRVIGFSKKKFVP